MAMVTVVNQSQWTKRHIRANIQMFLFSLQALSALTMSEAAFEGSPRAVTKARVVWYSYDEKDDEQESETIVRVVCDRADLCGDKVWSLWPGLQAQENVRRTSTEVDGPPHPQH
jgi:hypothetical protein